MPQSCECHFQLLVLIADWIRSSSGLFKEARNQTRTVTLLGSPMQGPERRLIRKNNFLLKSNDLKKLRSLTKGRCSTEQLENAVNETRRSFQIYSKFQPSCKSFTSFVVLQTVLLLQARQNW
jgi:hypothetical protein